MSLPSAAATAAPPVPRAAGAVRTATIAGFTARAHCSLDSIAPAWRALEGGGACTAYQRLDWAGPVVAHLAAASGASPVLVEVIDAATGDLVMIAPLALVRRRGHRVVTWLDLGVCDYAAPILAAGIDLSPERMKAAWAAIRAALPPADLIQISRIAAEAQGRRNPLATLEGVKTMEMQASGVALDGPAETVIQRVCRPAAVKELAKLRRRIERAGEVAFVEATTPEQVDAIFDALVAQRVARFKEIGRFDLLSRPEVEAFYRDGAKLGLAGGPARLFGLSVGGEWIAATYNLVHGGACHGLILTMAGGPWRNASPGLQIVAETMMWARAEGLGYFDFTVGVMPYKKDFGVIARDLSELTQALTFRGALVTRAASGAEGAKAWLRARPALFARAQKARRWLRQKGVRCCFRMLLSETASLRPRGA